MDKYRLSKVAKEDLIRIHQYGTAQFGEERADKYLMHSSTSLILLRKDHMHLNQLNSSKKDIGNVFAEWTQSSIELRKRW
ncbi:MAG: hypothetical protein ACI8TA_002689 [Cyclobacteriaceae bacterium]|jgi:hypothetical protein